MTSFATALTAAVVGGFVPPAFAWSSKVHAMVGDVATPLLTPTASAAVIELLRDDRAADGTPSGRTTLGEVASWPDEVRPLPAYQATYRHHFDGIPTCASGERPPSKLSHCEGGACGTVWFRRQMAVLADRNAPARERNEALKWIVHLAGDLHQPLHAADHADRGGNDVAVTFFGKRMDDPVSGRTQGPYNLHAAWDRLIPYRMFDERGGTGAFLADRPTEATRRAWSVGDIDAWTFESHVLARDFVYPALRTPMTCGQRVTAVVDLDDDYVRPAAEIAAGQIRKAGVRLARVLNDILSSP